jgi:hypothetical protein
MEKKVPRKIFIDPRKEVKKTVLKKPQKTNFDIYDHVSSKRAISTAEFNNFLRVLKLDLRSGALDREEYDFYARLANKKHESFLKRTVSEESTQETSNSEEYARRLKEREYEEKLKELEEKKLLERESMEKEPLEENKKIPILKRIKSFLGKPSVRIFAFIILAAFLLYYLTRSTMSSAIQNPSILIVVVLIIIIILGRGGKTRTYDPNMF